MPVVIGFHPIFELPDGNRDDWTVSLDAKTHWIEIPQRLPTGETQPIENFFGSDRTAIQLKKYALIDDVFTDLVRDANGRATMKLMYNGKELDVILGPKFKTVLAWSTPLPGAAAAAVEDGGGGRGAPVRRARRAARSSGPFPVDPAQGVKVAPPAVPPADGAPAPTSQGLHRLRADGRDHQRAQPRAQGRLQGAAEHSARRFVGRELLDHDERLLIGRTLQPSACLTTARIFSRPVFRFSSALFAQVLLVEQLEREVAAEPVVAQVTKDLPERRHAVARIDTVAVVQRRRIRGLRIVVDVHDVQSAAVDLLQARERRAALVDVEDVEQQARVGLPGRDRHVDAVLQRAEHRMRAPQLEQRLHAHRPSHLERLDIVLRRRCRG